MVQQQVVAWFIVRDGQQTGPVSEHEMHAMISRGLLKPTDMVWRDGFADWQPSYQAFRMAQPAPPQVPQPPPFKGNAAQPRGEHQALPVGEPERIVRDVLGEFRITQKIGVVRDVQAITRVSSSSAGGGGLIQVGSGYIASPSVSVTSHTTQRVFIADSHGEEWHVEAGEGFAVRTGNRIKVAFVSRGKNTSVGFAKNLDTGKSTYWQMNSILPGFFWCWVIAGYLLLASTHLTYGIFTLPSPLGMFIPGFVWRMSPLSYYGTSFLIHAVEALLFFFAFGLLRKRTRRKIWAAMEK